MRTIQRQLFCLPVILMLGLLQTGAAHAQNGQVSNGISVGRPKVFDNRTLTLMLESLSESLRNVQNQFVDQKALAAALSTLQGLHSNDVTTNTSITASPIPSLHQENTTSTGNATSSGTPLPNTATQKTISDRPSFTPQAPSLESPATFPAGFNPSFGPNASDLLGDQVNLTYQIFNLRMILERSLSDRLLDDQPRRQAVLGFNVTIDPPRTANDAVAVVEITLDLTGDHCVSQDCLSLVSLMPQEKTYNSAALSTKSNSFGGAAVVNMFQVGFSERRRGQIFYLYRDNDTISYERMDGEHPKRLVFGWMFRPVLGRRSLSPGLRQLFAIVSLPSGDNFEGKQIGESAVQDKRVTSFLNASVSTYWKKYDKDTMTSFVGRDTNRAARFRDAVSFGLTKPELFSPRYTNNAKYDHIEVKPTEQYQDRLEPKLAMLTWRQIGPKSVIISARGDNFFTGTQVFIGDKTYTSLADGLNIKSNQAFDLLTNTDAIISGAGSIIGRYGSAIPLVSKATPPQGIGTITEVAVSPSVGGYRPIRIHLLNLPPQSVWGQPVITINGNFVPPPYDVDSRANTLSTSVPDSFLVKGGILRVSYPFLPAEWTVSGSVSLSISDPIVDFQITRLSNTAILVQTRDLMGFTKDRKSPQADLRPRWNDFCWNVVTGDGKPVPLRTMYCLAHDFGSHASAQQSTAKQATGAKAGGKPAEVPALRLLSSNSFTLNLDQGVPDKIALVDPYGTVFTLDVPKATQPPASATKIIDLNQYDAGWINVAVKDVDDVGLVEANQTQLKSRPAPADSDGNTSKAIQIEITRDLTAHPGNVEVSIMSKDGKKVVASLQLRIAATDKGGKPQ